MTQRSPAFLIYSYTREKGYVYLHVPMRFARECGVNSGCRFLGFVRDGKILIEQEGHAQLGAGTAKTE